MKNNDRNKLNEEWKQIRSKHPEFARAFVAQSFMLLEASQLNTAALIQVYMCKLLAIGAPVLNADYWEAQCNNLRQPIDVGGIIGCLGSVKGDPAGCFPSRSDWFDDPLLHEPVWEQPPIPPLK